MVKKTKSAKKPLNKAVAKEQRDYILLDRTGSMEGMWVEAIRAVNSYVEKLATDSVPTKVTLAVFDRNAGAFCFDVVRDDVKPSAWTAVSNTEVTPRGMTPLNQAIHSLVARANADNPERAAIIIMTDGYENASDAEFTQASAKALLDACRAKEWQVIFLGANFDNTVQARSLGGQIHQTVSMAEGNLCATMTLAAGKRGLYGATGQGIAYSEDERTQLRTKR